MDLNNPLPLDKIYEKAAEEYTGQKGTEVLTTEDKMATFTKPCREVKPQSPETVASENVDPETTLPIKRIELRHYGTELLTRDTGTAIRADIAGFLAAGYIVEASLDDVSDITPSVADEAFAKLAQVVGHDAFERRVRIVGGTQLANRLVGFVLKTRQSKSI